jgi:hypothetical protein
MLEMKKRKRGEFVLEKVWVPDNEQLVEIVDRRQAELDWREAQICFVNLSAAWEIGKEYSVMRQLDVAESRLIQLFMNDDDWHFSSTKEVKGKAWSAYRRHLLYHTRARS